MAGNMSLSTVTTSSEAFKYPLPSVRQFHKQLHTALDEKNARLRTLVGGSYRQLLGTAEMIVEMRRDIEVVDSKLGRVAEGCGRSVIGRKISSLGKLGAPGGIRDDSGTEVQLSWIARMKMLTGCITVVGRLLKGKGHNSDSGSNRGQRLVHAAKVLVLSRLLLKSLGDEGTKDEESYMGSMIEEMRRKYMLLKKRLSRGIDRILERADGDREDLLQAMSAHSLATNSGAKDVLHHFLSIRGEAMAMKLEEESENITKAEREDNVLFAVNLYTKTLLDVQALTPQRLSSELSRLKAKPLLADDSIRKLEGLRLDIFEKWFGDEIIFFTPYIRHDDLQGSQAVESLQGWSKKASEVLTHGLKKIQDRTSDFKSVVDMRTRVLELWISEGSKAKGFDSSVFLDELRLVFNKRMNELLEGTISKLHLVGTEVEATLAAWTPGVNDIHKQLWTSDLLDMELSNGAGSFKKAIAAQVHGRSDTVSRIVNGYKAWRHLVNDVCNLVEAMKKQKWDDDLEILDEDDVVEDRKTLLSTDDPLALEKHIKESLDVAFQKLYEKLSKLQDIYSADGNSGPVAIFFIRILRGIRTDLPNHVKIQSFGLPMVPKLHEACALSVSANPISTFIISISKKRKLPEKALWEGSPDIPVQLSPATFKLLHNLMSAMATAGSDLWSNTAVVKLKSSVNENLTRQWGPILQTFLSLGPPEASSPTGVVKGSSEEAEVPNGDSTSEDAPTKKSSQVRNPNADFIDKELKEQIAAQWLFDILVLKQCVGQGSPSGSVPGLTSLEELIISHVDQVQVPLKQLQPAAQECWKRISLLFGILA